jgi:branched-chain amino acid transport system ATP-binding protein
MTHPGSQGPRSADTAVAPRADASDAPDALLEVRGLSKSFRGLQALTDYELRLAAGTIHGVIGPNGAGKTTLFHLLSGFLRPSAGSIRFAGRDITGEPSYRVARRGIARTFQNIRLFGDLPVIDNVNAGLQAHAPRSIVRTLLTSSRFRAEERELTERAMAMLALFGLESHGDRLARHLS